MSWLIPYSELTYEQQRVIHLHTTKHCAIDINSVDLNACTPLSASTSVTEYELKQMFGKELNPEEYLSIIRDDKMLSTHLYYLSLLRDEPKLAERYRNEVG